MVRLGAKEEAKEIDKRLAKEREKRMEKIPKKEKVILSATEEHDCPFCKSYFNESDECVRKEYCKAHHGIEQLESNEQGEEDARASNM